MKGLIFKSQGIKPMCQSQCLSRIYGLSSCFDHDFIGGWFSS